MPLVNEATGRTICREIRFARTTWTRTRGLLGRPPLAEGEALWIEPCQAVHMFFMRYPIDVIFLDAEGGVVGLRARLRPWRMTRYFAGARVALELPPGAAEAAGVEVGHRLVWTGDPEGSPWSRP